MSNANSPEELGFTRLSQAWSLERMKREQMLLRRLELDVPGVSTIATRRLAIRAAILDRKLSEAIVGKDSTGKPITYRAAFELTFEQPLTPPGESRC